MKYKTKETIQFRQSFSSAARGSRSILSFPLRLTLPCLLFFFYLTPSERQAASRYSSKLSSVALQTKALQHEIQPVH
ncbi:hypothetical protein OUZ56_002067 [Daphnia magna]|uniref:Uncharacterized protein n=1 Tax=Daphnia magna TaxID=35525 RepID=A0ABR0A4L0_9CRUS|nr:hypothetical protein OUZ56_002067 [Daphnia magna]